MPRKYGVLKDAVKLLCLLLVLQGVWIVESMGEDGVSPMDAPIDAVTPRIKGDGATVWVGRTAYRDCHVQTASADGKIVTLSTSTGVIQVEWPKVRATDRKQKLFAEYSREVARAVEEASPTPGPSPDKKWSEATTVKEVQGSAEVIQQGRAIPARADLPLKAGDELQTEPASNVILQFPGSDVVYVMPQTRVRIESIFLFVGKVVVRAKGRFAVKTEFVTAGVEGTEFSVSVDAKNTVSVGVLKGSVRLESRTGSWQPVPVKSNEVYRIPQKQPPSKDPNPQGDLDQIRQLIEEIDKRRTRVAPGAKGDASYLTDAQGRRYLVSNSDYLRLSKLRDAIEAERASLNRRSQEAIDAYNRKVDAFNADLKRVGTPVR